MGTCPTGTCGNQRLGEIRRLERGQRPAPRAGLNTSWIGTDASAPTCPDPGDVQVTLMLVPDMQSSNAASSLSVSTAGNR